MKRKALTYEIAIAGIGTALSLLGIVLYYYVPWAKISFLALAGVALQLPLLVQSRRGCLLAYVATGGLAIAIIGPVAALPYVFLFGWQPVVMGYCLRYKAKLYISLPLKGVLALLGAYGTFALYGLGETGTNVLARLGWSPSLWVLALIVAVLWLGYDYLMQWVLRYLDRRLAKVIAKYKPRTEERTRHEAPTAPTDQDVFGEGAQDDRPDGDDKNEVDDE